MPGIYEKKSLKKLKAETVPRAIAALLDGVIITIPVGIVMAILGFIPFLGVIGQLVGLAAIGAYMALRDAPGPLPSIGKKLMSVQAVDFETGKPLTQEQSVRRNLLAVAGAAVGILGVVLSYVPYLGALLNFLLSLGVAGAAVYDLWTWFRDPMGRRWMDHMAGTVVVGLEPAEAEELEEEDQAAP